MTDNFIPIVSNTPPPIDDEEFNDDFTDFAGATNNWGSDDEFGNFSGPTPVSDDSLGSPLKVCHEIATDNIFTPIFEDKITHDANSFSNHTKDTTTLSPECNPKNPLATEDFLSNSIKTSIHDTSTFNGSSIHIVEQPENSQDELSSESLNSDLQLPTNSHKSDSFVNPIKAGFECDDFEAFNESEDLSTDIILDQNSSTPTENFKDSKRNIDASGSSVSNGISECCTVNAELSDSFSHVVEGVNKNVVEEMSVSHSESASSECPLTSDPRTVRNLNSFQTLESSSLSDITIIEVSVQSEAVQDESENNGHFNDKSVHDEEECAHEISTPSVSPSVSNSIKSEETEDLPSVEFSETTLEKQTVSFLPTVPACDKDDNFADFHSDDCLSNKSEQESSNNIVSEGTLDHDAETTLEAPSQLVVNAFANFETDAVTNCVDAGSSSEPTFDDFANFESSKATNNDSAIMPLEHGFKGFEDLKFQKESEEFEQNSAGFILSNQTNSEEKDDCSNNDFADFASFDNSVVNTADGNVTTYAIEHDKGAFPISDSNEFTSTDKFATFDDADNDFGDFDDNNFASFQTSNDDDFGDFGMPSQDIAFPQAFPTKPTLNSVIDKVSKISHWFPKRESLSNEETTISENNISLIHCHVEENIVPLFNSDSTSSTAILGAKKLLKSPTELWDSLEDVDNTIALMFSWNNSSNHQRLLNSLGVNTQNILFSGSRAPIYVPNYAAGLGLLEPATDVTKPMSAADKITATSPTEKPPNIDGAWATETGGAADSRSHGNRGDTNSLAPTSGYSAITLNFDALEVASTKRSGSSPSPEQDKMDPELLEFAMSVTPDTTPAKKSDPLSKILATLKVSSSSKKSEDKEELSPEAAKIISELPDLSYMRSHVLMFPLGKGTATS